MDKSFLVRIFGFRATFIHGDLLVLDRWLWLKKRLPVTRNGEKLIDAGCGSGAFTIGAARRGYDAIGKLVLLALQIAMERAEICNAKSTSFPIQDIRFLHERTEFAGKFDVAISFENIEHVIDDRKLMKDIYRVLKPGGCLLLTTPNYYYEAMSPGDNGPFSREEDGWHVRRGYSAAMLAELCAESGFMVEEISSCSGFFSQRVTTLLRAIRPSALGWVLTLPFRILPVLFDRILHKLTGWPDYSICMVAYKPRFAKE